MDSTSSQSPAWPKPDVLLGRNSLPYDVRVELPQFAKATSTLGIDARCLSDGAETRLALPRARPSNVAAPGILEGSSMVVSGIRSSCISLTRDGNRSAPTMGLGKVDSLAPRPAPRHACLLTPKEVDPLLNPPPVANEPRPTTGVSGDSFSGARTRWAGPTSTTHHLPYPIGPPSSDLLRMPGECSVSHASTSCQLASFTRGEESLDRRVTSPGASL